MKKQKMKRIHSVKLQGLRRRRTGHNEAQRKKESTRVANIARMRKGRQKRAGLLVIPAVGEHASGEMVSAELSTRKNKRKIGDPL